MAAVVCKVASRRFSSGQLIIFAARNGREALGRPRVCEELDSILFLLNRQVGICKDGHSGTIKVFSTLLAFIINVFDYL